MIITRDNWGNLSGKLASLVRKPVGAVVVRVKVAPCKGLMCKCDAKLVIFFETS